MLNLLLLAAFAAEPIGEIAAVARDVGQSQIVLIDTATGSSRTLAACNGNCGSTVWSPNGERLAYVDAVGDARRITVMRADGSDARVVSQRFPINAEPAWAFDGARIAYAAGELEPDRIVVGAVSTGRETVWGQTDVRLRAPAWLPDPRMVAALAEQVDEGVTPGLQMDLEWGGLMAIALEGTPVAEGDAEAAEESATLRNVTTEIYVVTLRHAFAIPRVAMPSHGRYAEWTARPDAKGQRVAFESNDGGDREIFAATTDGAFDLSNHHAADWNPVWAPSGQWLAFESFRSGTRGIYRAHRETARNEAVAVAQAGDFWSPTWSPDARWIVCAGNPDGPSQLYAASVGGGTLRRITHDDAVAFDAPAWRPRP